MVAFGEQGADERVSVTGEAVERVRPIVQELTLCQLVGRDVVAQPDQARAKALHHLAHMTDVGLGRADADDRRIDACAADAD